MIEPEFRVMFESSPGLYLALLADAPRYTIIAVSDAYLRATFTTREDLLGRGLFELAFAKAPAEASQLSNSLQRAVATACPDAIPVRRHDVDRPIDQGGGTEERWWVVINTPARGRDGKIVYLIHSVEDVTKLVQLRRKGHGRVQAAAGMHAPMGQPAASRPDGRSHDGQDAARAGVPNWRELYEQAANRIRIGDILADDLERCVEQRTRQLRKLVRELEMVEGRERRQIARDLHDDLGQLLAAAGIRLVGLCRDPREDVRRSALEVADLLDRANRSTRSLAAQLEPAILYELGLAPALELLAEEVSERYELLIDIQDDGLPKPLPPEARRILYRAVRELVINVAKHAAVKRAVVSLVRESGWLTLRVDDAGVGFTPTRLQPGQSGIGLASVHERLSYIGGSYEIHSAPGEGTEVSLRVPLDPDQG